MRSLGRFIWLIISLLLVTIAVAFATSNGVLITLYLWPLDSTLTAPTWMVVMSSFIIGGLFSVCLMWAQALTIRTRLWNLQVKFNRLKAEMAHQRSAEKTLNDKKADGFVTAKHAPAPISKDQEAKAFSSEPLRTDHTLR